FIKNKHLFDKPLYALLCILGCIVMFTFKLPISENLANHLTGILFFVSLYTLGKLVMTWKVTHTIFTQLSRVTFALFLFHHKFIFAVLNYANPVGVIQVLVLLFCAILVFLLLSKALVVLTNAVTRRIDPWLRKKLFPV
ncbi:MAG: hypothetical protein J6M10_04640, partial [Clostridia bacterium]|nr:hypothetical protein [Clostridia bacterium]